MCEKRSVQFTLDKNWVESNDVRVDELERALSKLRWDGYIEYGKDIGESLFTVRPTKLWLEEYDKYCSE